MKLTCPKCRKVLPQIGNEILSPGDRVKCGICGHIWLFSRPTAKLVEAPLTVGGGDCAETASKPGSRHRPFQSNPLPKSEGTISRQRKWQLLQESRGRCTQCSYPHAPGLKLCKKCAFKNLRASRRLTGAKRRYRNARIYKLGKQPTKITNHEKSIGSI